jgi:protein-S-isoprenylcysteine O-methyltransferase Ste14
MKLNIATLLVIVVAVVFLGLHGREVPWTPLRIAGAAIAAPAFLLLALARLQLGRAFSVEAKATTLVTTGLYSRIRNPIYVFGGLMIAGVILLLDKPWFLLVFFFLIPMQVIRGRKEAKVLEEHFGAEYQEYKRKTWF